MNHLLQLTAEPSAQLQVETSRSEQSWRSLNDGPNSDRASYNAIEFHGREKHKYDHLRSVCSGIVLEEWVEHDARCLLRMRLRRNYEFDSLSVGAFVSVIPGSETGILLRRTKDRAWM
jgi:hypothetical protein